MREKLLAAKHRIAMLKEILADDVQFKDYELISTFDFNNMYDADEEKAMIYSGIWNHSDKHIQGHWFDEIIKDADVLHHSLRNPSEDYYFSKDRTRQILGELL